MRTRLTGALAALVLAGAVSGLWWDAGQAPAPPAASLPVPPFPPRIAAGETYEHCLAVLADDPDSAKPIADYRLRLDLDHLNMMFNGWTVGASGAPEERGEPVLDQTYSPIQ